MFINKQGMISGFTDFICFIFCWEIACSVCLATHQIQQSFKSIKTRRDTLDIVYWLSCGVCVWGVCVCVWLFRLKIQIQWVMCKCSITKQYFVFNSLFFGTSCQKDAMLSFPHLDLSIQGNIRHFYCCRWDFLHRLLVLCQTCIMLSFQVSKKQQKILKKKKKKLKYMQEKASHIFE